tara:strand:- start:730 stop:1242 length:513 start_codon:yes stop_codon:yes gene_type:complete
MAKRVPITRVNKYFGGEDFNLQTNMGMEWLHGWLNFTVVLYRVDRENTNVDSVYAEAGKGEIRFFPPVEVKGYVAIEQPTNDSYGSGLVERLEPGNMKLSIYKKHLEELEVEIKYGDYIGYAETEDKMRYYTVANAGQVTSDNAHTILGYKAFFRTFICTPVQEDEFNGI